MADYQQKCGALKERLHATQQQNELMTVMIERTKKMIQRTRLERALLLEKLEQVATQPGPVDDQDFSPPPSPLSGTADDVPNGSAAAAAAKKTAPKLPNAYTVYCDEMRPAVVKELEASGQGSKTALVQRTLSEQWKALSKNDKKPYSERAKQLKESRRLAAANGSIEDTEDESRIKDETEEPPETTQEPEEPVHKPEAAPERASEPEPEPEPEQGATPGASSQPL